MQCCLSSFSFDVDVLCVLNVFDMSSEGRGHLISCAHGSYNHVCLSYVGLVYLFRFKVLTAISIRPSLASLSGKVSRAEMALRE